MKRSVIETILGAVVIIVAVFFLASSYQSANMGSVNGYEVMADFSGIGGLKPGDDVQISGVKVGTVKDVSLNDDNYLARVTISVSDSIKLPTDTAALISSESLLGGRYLSLEPGADEEMLEPGDRIQYTQAPQNLEQLLGQFIFSMNDAKEEKTAQPQTQAQSAPVASSAPETPAMLQAPTDDEAQQ